MFSSKLVGKKKKIEVMTKKTVETQPIGMDHLPKLKGPWGNVFLETVILRIIGMA